MRILVPGGGAYSLREFITKGRWVTAAGKRALFFLKPARQRKRFMKGGISVLLRCWHESTSTGLQLRYVDVPCHPKRDMSDNMAGSAAISASGVISASPICVAASKSKIFNP